VDEGRSLEAGAPHAVPPPGPHRGSGGSPARAPARPEPIPAANEPGGDEAAPRRRRGKRVLFGALALVALVGAAAWWIHGLGYEDTDDARIDGDIAAISSRVPGTVTAVRVTDNQRVRAGQVLLELDPTDLEVSLAEARAAVAQAQARLASGLPGVAVTSATDRAAVEQAQAEVEAAETAEEASRRALDQARAGEQLSRLELDRGRELEAGGSMARAELDQRETAHQVAAAGLAAAGKELQGREARLRAARAHQAEVERNASPHLRISQAAVEAAQAELALARAREHQAELNLGYARVVAPSDGIVGRKAVHPGERVQVGQQLLALTGADPLWVTADFRETQVRRMRAGQQATVHVDALGRDLRGEVESFPGATGSQYSLLPPENASGNYVKVVQRLPVRIRLDPGQPGLDQLRPGMSVEPTVALR
jgi:membrane fusion protein, multidrug efflux system